MFFGLPFTTKARPFLHVSGRNLSCMASCHRMCRHWRHKWLGRTSSFEVGRVRWRRILLWRVWKIRMWCCITRYLLLRTGSLKISHIYDAWLRDFFIRPVGQLGRWYLHDWWDSSSRPTWKKCLASSTRPRKAKRFRTFRGYSADQRGAFWVFLIRSGFMII